jgi:hypothetical protein
MATPFKDIHEKSAIWARRLIYIFWQQCITGTYLIPFLVQEKITRPFELHTSPKYTLIYIHFRRITAFSVITRNLKIQVLQDMPYQNTREMYGVINTAKFGLFYCLEKIMTNIALITQVVIIMCIVDTYYIYTVKSMTTDRKSNDLLG